MKTLTINTFKPYQIFFGTNYLLEFIGDFCNKLNKRFVIVTDSHLINLYGNELKKSLQKSGCNVELFFFQAGESNKTRHTKEILEDQLLQQQYGRDTILIALGGGVVTDLVGFLAATYCRGIPVIYIPTTLLGMVDATIGGKTAINTPFGKNLIGTFTQPLVVFIDTFFLSSLSKRELSNGVVEIIKHSMLADEDLFNNLHTQGKNIFNSNADLTELIYTSCCIKKNIIEKDEQENHLRELLNFGHTIGHAIEFIEKFNIMHGEAVAIGMLVEAYLSFKSGYLDEEKVIYLQKVLQNFDLPLKTHAFKNNDFSNVLIQDKKSKNKIPHFVLLTDIGKPYRFFAVPVEFDILLQTIKWAGQQFS